MSDFMCACVYVCAGLGSKTTLHKTLQLHNTLHASMINLLKPCRLLCSVLM